MPIETQKSQSFAYTTDNGDTKNMAPSILLNQVKPIDIVSVINSVHLN